MPKKLASLIFAFVLLLMSVRVVQAAGLQVEPIRQEAIGQADKATQLRFQVTNPADQMVEVKVTFKDVETLNEKGVPSFKAEAESKSGLWIAYFSAKSSDGKELVNKTVTDPSEYFFTLPAKTTAIVEVQRTILKDDPKSLFFAVFFTASDPSTAKTPVSIQTSIGSLVALTRSDLPAAATLEFLPGSWKKSDQAWSVPLTLKNTGNIHLKLNGQTWLEPGWGNGQKAGEKKELNPLGRWVLPKDTLVLELASVQHGKWLPELWYLRADFHLNGEQQQKKIPVMWLPTLALIPIAVFLGILIVIIAVLVWRIRRPQH
jgi:P pilus assembly chaperone PapD